MVTIVNPETHVGCVVCDRPVKFWLDREGRTRLHGHKNGPDKCPGGNAVAGEAARPSPPEPKRPRRSTVDIAAPRSVDQIIRSVGHPTKGVGLWLRDRGFTEPAPEVVLHGPPGPSIPWSTRREMTADDDADILYAHLNRETLRDAKRDDPDTVCGAVQSDTWLRHPRTCPRCAELAPVLGPPEPPPEEFRASDRDHVFRPDRKLPEDAREAARLALEWAGHSRIPPDVKDQVRPFFGPIGPHAVPRYPTGPKATLERYLGARNLLLEELVTIEVDGVQMTGHDWKDQMSRVKAFEKARMDELIDQVTSVTGISSARARQMSAFELQRALERAQPQEES